MPAGPAKAGLQTAAMGEKAIVPLSGVGQSAGMKPVDIQVIGSELAVKWSDGAESFIPLEKLRRACPCAGCKGEMDVMGNLYKGPDLPLKAESFKLRGISWVGTYAVQPNWADGHNSGLFSFEYLRHLAAD